MMIAARGTRAPTQLRAQQTRRALVTAAERSFAADGYDATTAKMIAEKARVATGSFYQYFTSKDDILREIARERYAQVVERVLGALAGTPAPGGEAAHVLEEIRSRMRTIVEITLAFHIEHKGLQRVIHERRGIDAELDAPIVEGERKLIARVAELLAEWGRHGDVEATSYVLFNAVRGAVHAHVIGRALVDDQRFAAATVDAMIRIALPASFFVPV